jgi:flagellar protein FlaG
VEAINRQLSEASRTVRFSLDQHTGHVIVRVVDTETEQVIRQIPSEEALAISQSIERLQGMLVHLKA